jgi:glycyl-tRNA synthetase beta subunit
MVLDYSKTGVCRKLLCMFMCCCRSKRHADKVKVFAKARLLASEELNVTSIIKAQREAAALAQLAKGDDLKKIEAAVKRIINVLDADADVSETGRKLKSGTVGDDEDPNAE